MSAAETLREAAKVLRGRAEAATPGPWAVRAGNVEHYFPYLGGYGVIASPLESDATLIATMHPGVALALADWLDAEAAVQGSMEPMAELVSVCVEQAGGPAGYVTIGHDDDGNPQMHADSSPAALRVAEAILGGGGRG